MEKRERKGRIGTIHAEETLFLRVNVGVAKDGDLAYEMTIHAGTSAPIILSKQTGKWWTIEWKDLIDLARHEGIDEKNEKPERRRR